MIDLSSLHQAATKSLADAGIDTARLDAEVLLRHVLRLSREEFLLQKGRAVSEDERAAFDALLTRRAAREPLQYITGLQEFWSLEFEVTPDTLIPRADSETIVESALSFFPNKTAPLRVLDLGAGSGCLLLSFLSEYPNATGVAVDRSFAALEVVKRNAQRLGLASRVSYLCGDWAGALSGSFDVILSNPPYIPRSHEATLQPEVGQFEPHKALFAEEDGLACYRVLAPMIARLLTPSGYAFLEFGMGQATDVGECLTASGALSIVRIARDLAGIERVAIVQKNNERGFLCR